jgi:hypothetical protein
MDPLVSRRSFFSIRSLLSTVGILLLVLIISCKIQFRDEFSGHLQSGWKWINPQGDSSMSLDARKGFLRITVCGYHDLWAEADNFNAPRLMRSIKGDFTLVTKINGPKRWCGGLLAWKDRNNFVRFERGIHFRNELCFECANQGEHKLLAADYAAGDPTWLRLTRKGSTFTAAFSFNAVDWLPLKRLWKGRNFGFKKQPPHVEDGRSMLAEEDLKFDPGESYAKMYASGPLLVGLSGLVPSIAPPEGVKETVTDYDYFAIVKP